MFRFRLLGALCVAVLCLVVQARAQADPLPVPAHEGFISDTTGVLTPADRGRLAARLVELDRERGSSSASSSSSAPIRRR